MEKSYQKGQKRNIAFLFHFTIIQALSHLSKVGFFFFLRMQEK